MDDLAWSIHQYLLEESTVFQNKNLVLLPITVIAKKFKRNHRTISRRLTALKAEGLIKTIKFTVPGCRAGGGSWGARSGPHMAASGGRRPLA